MDLFDLASRRQPPSDDIEKQYSIPDSAPIANDHVGQTTAPDTSPWSATAQEIWAAPQNLTSKPQSADQVFDATPPEAPRETCEEDPLLTKTTPDKPSTDRTAEIKPTGAEKAPAAADLQKSMIWLEKAVQISDKTDTKAAVSRIVTGQTVGLDLVEILTTPGLSADRRREVSEMNLRVHAEKFHDYAKYLDPALARAELALAKISSGDDKKIKEGEKGLIEAVSLRPELQVDAAFQRKLLNAYHQMETFRKAKGLPEWTNELKPNHADGDTKYDTTKIDQSMERANEAYGDKGIGTALPHFEAAIKAADEVPQDQVNRDLTELFCKRLTLERAIIAGELREQNVDKLVAEHKVAKDQEWAKYRDHLAPGSTRVNFGLAMISSGDPEMLKRGKAMLQDAISKRPELEFSVDYVNHLKKAFEAHHQNKPQPAAETIPGFETQNPRPPGNEQARSQSGTETEKPKKPIDKFEVGYKKFSTKDLGKAATDLEKDKEVVAYTSDRVTGPVLTAACLYLGYKVTKGRLEAIRARRSGSSTAADATTSADNKGAGDAGKPEAPKPDASKPDSIKPDAAKPDSTKPADTGEKPPATSGTTGDTKPTESETKPPEAKSEGKPDAAAAEKLPLAERIKTASAEIQPGLKQLYKLARNPENKGKHYDRLVNDLIELDKSGKLDSDMKWYLRKDFKEFLANDGVEALQEYVDGTKPKAPKPTEAMQRPPISGEQRKAATDAAFSQARDAIRTYGQTEMTKDAKDFTNKILEKYFPGAEAVEVFAGSEGLGVKLNDGTVLKFRPNTEWDASWGHRRLDMPLLAIDGGEPRPMLVGPEGKQWIVYRQPFGETPDPAKVQDFVKTVKRAQGNTGDFGRAVDAASRQVGNYKTPEGKVEVRTFDYAALEIDKEGEYEFGEQDTLDLSKKTNTEDAKPSGKSETNVETTKSEKVATEPSKPIEAKPDATKTDVAKRATVKPDGPKPELSRPATTSGGTVDEIPIETSPFERGAEEQPKIDRPGSAMEAGKMIEIKLPGGIIARMAKADAPKFLDRMEKEFKTGDFGKVIDEMLSDKSRTEEEKTELRDLKSRYDQLPPEAKEECKAEFFANVRSQLGIKAETTEAERGRTSRVGRTLAIGGGVLAVGILSTAVLRHMMQRETQRTIDRVQVEFKKDK